MRHFVALLLALAVFGPSGCSQQQAKSQQHQQLAGRMMRALEKADDKFVLDSFLYPPYETPTARSGDVAGLRRSLAIVREEFGTISDGRLTDEQPSTLNVLIGPGTFQYLSEHPSYSRHVYRVTYGRRGSGWIFIDTAVIDSKMGIRLLSFALPAHDPESAPFINTTFQRLVEATRPGPRE